MNDDAAKRDTSSRKNVFVKAFLEETATVTATLPTGYTEEMAGAGDLQMHRQTTPTEQAAIKK